MKVDNAHASDRQQLAIAKLEYADLQPGQEVTVAGCFFGYVLEHIYAEDGFQMFVIGDQVQHPQELTLLFKGSSGLIKGNPETWTNEWLQTNFPILMAMLFGSPHPPSQLETAGRELNRILKKYRSAKAYLYGHSLGAINLQYALAHCRHIGQVKRANLYEGPNLFNLFNHRERKHIRAFKHKSFNFVDVYDPVTLGYSDQRHLVGRLRYIKSNFNPPIAAHMWAGYQFDKSGTLVVQDIDERFRKKAMLYQTAVSQGQEWQDKLREKPTSSFLRTFKREELQARLASVIKYNQFVK